MSDCIHDCSTCASNCAERQEPQDLKEKLNDLSEVKKVIGIVSGKGGVGKSLVTSLLATLMQRRDYKVGILDADVTGPSIPKVFGINGRADGDENGLYPASRASSSSSGATSSGAISTLCSSICLPERATCR